MNAKNKKEKTNLKEEKKKRICRVCGTRNAVIKKYNLGICRRCFKDVAEKLGFQKYG